MYQERGPGKVKAAILTISPTGCILVYKIMGANPICLLHLNCGDDSFFFHCPDFDNKIGIAQCQFTCLAIIGRLIDLEK